MFVTRLVFCAMIATLFAPLRAAYVYTSAAGGTAPQCCYFYDNETHDVGTEKAVAYSRGFSAGAYANYGGVGANTYSNCVGVLGPRCSSFASAVAEFKDTLTILGVSGYIESQAFFRQHLLDGNASGNFSIGDQYFSWLGGRYETFPASPGAMRFAFTADVPFTIFAHVEASACQDGGIFCYAGSSDGEGYENFGQFKVFDLTNNPVSNFSYATESGSPYNIAGGTNVSAPEPATFFTAGAMLLVLLARLFKAKRRLSAW
jgi:hypothetical protein